jgi:hypothetical protein
MRPTSASTTQKISVNMFSFGRLAVDRHRS